MLRYMTGILYFLLAWETSAQYVTYEYDIKPIMQRHCVSCHVPGEAGPMPLTSYEEVSAYGPLISYMTSARLMPPWQADPSYSHFKDERLLSEEEIHLIRDWVSGEMKPGALPYGMAISNVAGVTVYPREPDLILGLDSSFIQPGDYKDRYQEFRIATGLEEDTWIEAIKFVPGSKQIIRYAAVSVVPPIGSYESDKQPLWYEWSPLQKTIYHVDGLGKFIPKGSDLLLYIHYGPSSKEMHDSSTVQLHFASERIRRFISNVPLINKYLLSGDTLYIEANQVKRFNASYTLPHDIELFRLTPHANIFCRKWEIFAMIPGQSDMIPLLKINDWDFNRRQSYQFETPLQLPAGTIINAIALYDNTSVSTGNHGKLPVDISADEMFSVYFEYAATLPEVSDPVLVHIPSVISDAQLPVYLLPTKKGPYVFKVTTFETGQEIFHQIFTLSDVQQNMELQLPEMSNGNYHLTISNSDHQAVASHVFLLDRK